VLDEADDGHAVGGLGRHRPQGLHVGGHEAGLQQEVLGRVAGDGQLGEGGDIGPGLDRLPVGGQDALDVAVQVADAGVDLAGSDAQAGHRASVPTGSGRPGRLPFDRHMRTFACVTRVPV